MGYSWNLATYGLMTVVWSTQLALWHFAWQHAAYLCDFRRPVFLLQTLISCLLGPVTVGLLGYFFSSLVGDRDSAWAAQTSELQLLDDITDVENSELGRRVSTAYDLLRHCREQSRQLGQDRRWAWRRVAGLGCKCAAYLLLVAYAGHPALLALPRPPPAVPGAAGGAGGQGLSDASNWAACYYEWAAILAAEVVSAVEWTVKLSEIFLGGSSAHLDVFRQPDCPPRPMIAVASLWNVCLLLGLTWALEYFVDMSRLLLGDVRELTDVVNDERSVWEERKRARREREDAAKKEAQEAKKKEAQEAKKGEHAARDAIAVAWESKGAAGAAAAADARRAGSASARVKTAVAAANKKATSAQIFLDLIVPENLIAWSRVRKTMVDTKRLRLGSDILSIAATSAAALWVILLLQAFDIVNLRKMMPFDAVGFAVLAHTLTFTIFPALSNGGSVNHYLRKHTAIIIKEHLRCRELRLERKVRACRVGTGSWRVCVCACVCVRV